MQSKFQLIELLVKFRSIISFSLICSVRSFPSSMAACTWDRRLFDKNEVIENFPSIKEKLELERGTESFGKIN